MIVYSSIILVFFLLIVCAILFVILKRPTPIDLVLGCICAMLPVNWFIEVGGLVVSPIYDVAFVLGVPIFVMNMLQHKHYRNRYVFMLICLFLGYQVWSFTARFVQAGGTSLQPVWALYRNDLISVVFLLAGIVLAWRPLNVQRCILAILIGTFALEATIGVVQTASQGRLLTGFYNNNNLYLGFLSPLPRVMIPPVVSTEVSSGATTDNGIFVGSIFRAVGTHLQANWFAVSMVGGIALCMGPMLVRQQPRWLRLWAMGAISLMLLALGLSFTRTGYVAFAAMCVWYVMFWQGFYQRLRTMQIIFVITLIALVVLVIGGLSFDSVRIKLGETVVTRLQGMQQPLEALVQENFRIKLWRIAFDRVGDSPWFGVREPIKLQQINPYMPLNIDVPLHNQLVSSIYNGGYILGGFYLFTHFWLLWKSGQLKSHKKYKPMLETWAITANLGFVGLAVESIGINWMAGASLPGLFWLLAGITVMQYRVIYVEEPSVVPVASHPPMRHIIVQ